jgi:outer membrane receptor protein involved in Fe transport
MTPLHKLATVLICCLLAFTGRTQIVVKGKVIDSTTKEPIHGASVRCIDPLCNAGAITNTSGEFEIRCQDCRKLNVSFVGYLPTHTAVSDIYQTISLSPAFSLLNMYVVSANRTAVKRSEAPVAISSIGAASIKETKAISADQLLNKVSGVHMVNLGNEQHQMSIRQPMTTKSLFLYLEDGIPLRTTGLFNHNALLEVNLAAVKNIEVIKGPSSSLYGSEAIGGVVNFLTLAPTAVPVLKLSVQGSSIGYKRSDLQTSFTSGKWGFALNGYYADKRNSFMEYTDFHKASFTARIDYRFSDKTDLSNSFTIVDYYSDMPGGVDSAMFASKKFSNPQTFTYRKVKAFRYRSTVTHSWNENSKTTASVVYRDNTIGQNPTYRIKDDFRKQGNQWIGNKSLAHGEINSSSFKSYAFIAQHRQKLNWKSAVISGGASVDVSPSGYDASYIRIKKDTLTGRYVSYQATDSTLTNYNTNITNYAGFVNFEFNPLRKLRVVASLRYDLFTYDFDNHLKPSAFSGSPDTVNNFKKLSPKIGFTYNFSSRTGIYANYSQGFVPPQISEMYTGVKTPSIQPATFYNYEVGGWAEIIKGRLSVDVSAYELYGNDEVISVKMEDGSTENRNAGKTSHKGIEMGLNYKPVTSISFRLSGAYSQHRFTEFVEKGINYSGNIMNNAPNWMHNAELWYRPAFVKGLRVGVEWQKIGAYFMDPQNTEKYQGYNVFNLRAGYQFKAFELWMHVLNTTDNYYSYISSRSGSRYSYQLAEPRNFTIGVSYDFGRIVKRLK